MMKDFANWGLDTAAARGASYADVRVMDTRQRKPSKLTVNLRIFDFGKLLLSVALLLTALHPQDAQSSFKRIRGKVGRGQSFEAAINERLVFRLSPLSGSDSLGWNVQVIDRIYPTEDLAGVLTPPYHGINDCVIEGWHFRNSRNTGPNKGEVNAPQMSREFQFLLDYANLEGARETLSRVLGSSGKEFAEARNKLRQFPAGAGKLKILELKLGNLMPGKQAWIEFMKFEVEVQIPAKSSLIP